MAINKDGKMGSAIDFEKEKLVIGVLYSKQGIKDKLVEILTAEFGSADYISDDLDFNFTDYYNGEMGEGIKRFFVSFSTLVDPSKLAEIKTITNFLEQKFAREGNRKVNLDPGMLSIERFMLATTKNNGHRIPLNSGIYAEVTLMFVSKHFQPLPWTYADYQSSEYQSILMEIRKKYKEDLKRQR